MANGFPYNETHLKKKESEEYALRCANGFESLQLNNKIERQKKHYIENIKYIEAIQDSKTYSNHLNRNLDILGMSNINLRTDVNYSPLGIIKLIYKSIYSRLDKIGIDVMVEGKDERTLKEKKAYINAIKIKKQLAPAIEEMTGLNPEQGQDNITEEELEMLELLGLPTAYEYLFEVLLKSTDDYNEYRQEIVPYINHSLICAGFAGTYLEYDSNGMIVERSILPNSVKVYGGTKQDYSDADGFLITKKISYHELVSYYLKDKLTSEETAFLQADSKKNSEIEVELMFWSATSTIAKKHVKKDDGTEYIREHGSIKGADYVININNWYSCYYIKSINKVFNFGSIKNMPRYKGKNGNRYAYCPVNIINTSVIVESDTTPIISVIRKFEDMANIAYIKLQEEIANARPSGYNINLASLNDAIGLLKDENADLKQADLIRLKLKTGIGITSHIDGQGDQTSQQAFIYEEGGLSKAYSEFAAVINMAIDWCYLFSGTPKIDSGAEQDYKLSNYVTKGIMEGADKAVVDLIQAKDKVILKSAEKKLNMIITIYGMDYKENPYRNILSEMENEYLADIDMNTRELFIRIEKAFTEAEEQNIRDMARLGMEKGMQTGGREGITYQEYIVFQEMFKENKKLANIKLALIMKKREKQKLAESQQMQVQNAMIQQQSAEQVMKKQMLIEQEKQKTMEKEKGLEIRNKAIELIVKSELEKGTNIEEILALIASQLAVAEQADQQPNEQQYYNDMDSQEPTMYDEAI